MPVIFIRLELMSIWFGISISNQLNYNIYIVLQAIYLSIPRRRNIDQFLGYIFHACNYISAYSLRNSHQGIVSHTLHLMSRKKEEEEEENNRWIQFGCIKSISSIYEIYLDSLVRRYIHRLQHCIGHYCNYSHVHNFRPMSRMGTADCTDLSSSQLYNRICPCMGDSFLLCFCHIHKPIHNFHRTYDQDKRVLHNIRLSTLLSKCSCHQMYCTLHHFYLIKCDKLLNFHRISIERIFWKSIGIIHTFAFLWTIQTISMTSTSIKAFGTMITGSALTFTGNMMTLCIKVAFALLLTIFTYWIINGEMN